VKQAALEVTLIYLQLLQQSTMNIESTFAMLKATVREHVRNKSDLTMKNEVLCKFLCHNIVVEHQSIIELGIEGVF
jgi:hypothetical protein